MAAIMDYYFYNADGSLVFSDHPTSGEVKIVFTDRSATIYIDGSDTPYEEVTFSTINTGYRVDKWGTIEENYSVGETYIYEDNGISLTVKVYAIAKEETTSKVLTIKYSGKTIATLEKGQTATIPCDGKEMATDLVVSISASANLISFTIDGITFQAEEGMTWGKWVESEYNTDNFYVDLYDDSVIRGAAWITIGSGGRVYGSNSIEENGVYKSQHGGGSN